MKSRSVLFACLLIVVMLLLAACGAPAATEVPPVYEAPATEAPAAAEAPSYYGQAEEALPANEPAPDVLDESVAPMSTSAAFEVKDSSGDLTVLERSNSMIIKNADVRLM